MQKIREQIVERRKQLNDETAGRQRDQVRGHHVNDGAAALRRSDIGHKEKHARAVPKQLARSHMLQMESANGMEMDDGEVADRVTQEDILHGSDEQTHRKKFDLRLDQLGPYTIDFSRNGSHVALVGKRGHLATFNWKDFALEGEAQLKDRCTDATFLVDHSMLAIAQRKFVYMYTKEGAEMHVLPSMANVDRLTYLPRHMLLAGCSSSYSVLHYLDVSTGKTVSSKAPGIVRDPSAAMSYNPTNGVIATADLRGVCKFWSPTVSEPLVQIKAHKGAIKDIAFHQNGRFALTLGVEGKLKVWDCRTLRALDEYKVTYGVDSLDISSSGLVAMGGGTSVHVWKDMFTASKPHGPYMKTQLGYGQTVSKLKFCPFEDVLGVGHSLGFTTMIIPGAGEANPDFYYANPYETEEHRKERVVGNLLDKLPAETISIDLQIANVDEKRLDEYHKNLAASRKARSIREKKVRKSEVATDNAGVAATGLPGGDDEIDEDLGVKEKGISKLWKSKELIQKEKKMKTWDNKDSIDKVRSKQKMRTSKHAQREKWNHMQGRILGDDSYTAVGGSDDAAFGVGPEKGGAKEGGGAKAERKPKRDRESATGPSADIMKNAALRRLL
jgi:hypothetical protein